MPPEDVSASETELPQWACSAGRGAQPSPGLVPNFIPGPAFTFYLSFFLKYGVLAHVWPNTPFSFAHKNGVLVTLHFVPETFSLAR